jgi:hypothetical protein
MLVDVINWLGVMAGLTAINVFGHDLILPSKNVKTVLKFPSTAVKADFLTEIAVSKLGSGPPIQTIRPLEPIPGTSHFIARALRHEVRQNARTGSGN